VTIAPVSRLGERLQRIAQIGPHERRAVALAFLCHFTMFSSYYILRPVRDTVATVFGTAELPWLYIGTFAGTLIASPIYAALATRLRLSSLLPGVFWFWLGNVALFEVLFRLVPQSAWVSGAYYIWFSVVNLYMISVFWTLMVDLFTPRQATRLFALIAAGGSLGAVAGPLITRSTVRLIGLDGLLVIAAGGFALVIVQVHLLMREKERLRASGDEVQDSTFTHELTGNPFEGFRRLFSSAYARNQALYMLLMTWINTVAYFLQVDVIAKSFSVLTDRTLAIADIDLLVNIFTAIVLIFGAGRFVQRFGVTAGLVLNPLILLVAFCGIALSPTYFMIRAVQVVRSVAQYAIARPSREICFTVVEQAERYRTKNVIDTVFYRLGDLTAAWLQVGLRELGLRVYSSVTLGFGASVLWGFVALRLGRRYEGLRRQRDLAIVTGPAASAPAGSVKALYEPEQ